MNVAGHYGTDIYTERGRLVDEFTIELTTGDQAGTMIAGKVLLLATGSSPNVISIDGLDDIPYETSETMLERDTLPESLIILGGGFVAMEWGQILHRLGVEVTILQRSDHVLSRMEGQLGRALEKYLAEEGIQIITKTQVQKVQSVPDGAMAGSAEIAGCR
ncbi:MAG TPA: FAD-dependent oxidoreductase [bacterium]|nr:FAD-dependent oxidoreductase [bacterium]